MSKFLFKIESAIFSRSPRPWPGVLTLAALTVFGNATHGAQVTAFYRGEKLIAPSYALKIGSSYYLRTNRDGLKSLLKVEGGIVTSALVEKWYSKYRVAVKYEIKNGKYQISKAIVTNRGTFLSAAAADSSTKICAMSEDDVTKLASVVASTEYVSSFIDSSCSALSPVKRVALSNLKQILMPDSDEGKKLLNCLGKLSSEVKNPSTRDRIIDLQASVIAMMKQQISTGTPGLKISCADEAVIGKSARCEANKGTVMFPIKDGGLTIEITEMQDKFVHELIHRSRTLVASNDYEENFTEFIVSKCSNRQTDHGGKFVELEESPKKTGEDLKKVPLPLKEAVAKLPPQKIETSTVDSLEQLATSKPTAGEKSNSNALAAAYEDAVAEPVQAFSTTTDAVARAFIPSANAAVESYNGGSSVSSSSSRNESASSRRSPASDSDSSYRPFEVTKTSGFGKIPQTGEKIVEEILVNRGDNNVLASKISVATADAPNLTIGNEVKIQESKTESLSELAKNTSVGGSTRINLDTGGSSANSIASVQTNRRSIASTTTESQSIGGIITVGNNVTGSNYQKFRKQIVEDSGFRTSLEKAGVLISRGGVLLSRPKQVNATYIDNGSSLIFAN